MRHSALAVLALAGTLLLSGAAQAGIVVTYGAGVTWPTAPDVQTAHPSQYIGYNHPYYGGYFTQSFKVATTLVVEKLYVMAAREQASTSLMWMKFYEVDNVHSVSLGTLVGTVAATANELSPSTSSVITEFALSGANQITLPARAGDAGYAILCYADDSSARWEAGKAGNVYADGYWGGSYAGTSDMIMALVGSPIPEPATMSLLVIGGVAALIRRKRQ
ncbi:MAG: PEP-CTERM sorting domain-containing protein [Planctomycetaceae bacterium]|nr:PEP-CTERM sorting domain-containing protein [Planctomycetaceae bacterium]